MKVAILFCSLLAIVTGLAPLYGTPKENVEEQNFIVIFKEELPDHYRLGHIDLLRDRVFATYSIGSFQGFAATLNSTLLKYQLESDNVKYVEVDGEVHAAADTCNQQNGATWGIQRLNKREIQLYGSYEYSGDAGSNVHAYIVDTGIRINHVEFGGRAIWGINFADSINDDCNGHGTHVAGTVGGSLYGVAKKTTLVAVKVLNCAGSGTASGVINGIQWVAKYGRKPAVANMSLGGGYYKAENDAVHAAVKAGVTFVVAAGNENQDACNTSPASEPSAITVGATYVANSKGRQIDTRASFSNYGGCVDILAPGVDITSAWYTSNTATNTISGTSMASPHVAGVAALYLDKYPDASPTEVEKALVGESTLDIVDLACGSSVCLKTPNLLLHSNCESFR